MNLYEELCSIVGEDHVLKDEPMSAHTTFRIGGPADYFVMPSEADEIGRIVELCRGADVPYYIIGNGSNLLVGDKGYRGVIIQVYKNMDRIEVQGNEIRVQAGRFSRRPPRPHARRDLQAWNLHPAYRGRSAGQSA